MFFYEHHSIIMRRAISFLLFLAMLFGTIFNGFEFVIKANAVEIIESGILENGIQWTYDSSDVLTFLGTGELLEFNYYELEPIRSGDVKCIVIEEGITEIGRSTFAFIFEAPRFVSLSLPSSLTKIGEYAFYDDFKLGGCITSLEYHGNAASWERIRIEVGNGPLLTAAFKSLNLEEIGALAGDSVSWNFNRNAVMSFSGNGRMDIRVHWYDFLSQTKTISIGEGISNITGSAFRDAQYATAVYIPTSVNLIDMDAFAGCYNLRNVYYGGTRDDWNRISIRSGNAALINASVHFEGDPIQWKLDESGTLKITGTGAMDSYENEYAPWHSLVPKIKKVVIGDGITNISNRAFYGCDRLESVSIGKDVKSIDARAFYRCDSLTEITVSASVKTVDINAFYGCDHLTAIHYAGSDQQWNKISIAAGNSFLKDSYDYEKYTIIYNLDRGTNHPGNPNSYTYASDTIILQKPMRNNSTFAGWFADADFQNPVTSIPNGSTGQVTLYAKWVFNGVPIRYVLNGGTNNSINPGAVKSGSTKLQNPTRKGYKFLGWYTDSNFTKQITDVSTDMGEEVTVHAKWGEERYTITYKLKKGKNSKKNPKTFTVNSSIALKSPTRKGYKFVGWYKDSKYRKKITSIPKGTTGNLTLYAKWKKK